MSGRFLSRASKDSDDDDLVRRQLSVLENVAGKNKLDDENDDMSSDVIGEENHDEQPRQPAAEKKSIIHQDVIIKGSITSSTELIINGTVNGDVTCEKELTVTGNIEGNVKAGNMKLLSGHIHGDIDSKNDVSIVKGASVKGNISANTLCCDGKIEGNTTVKGKAVITENAVVIGDIICEKISIREGAVCNGNIKTDASKAKASANKEASQSKDKEKAANAVVTNLKQYV